MALVGCKQGMLVSSLQGLRQVETCVSPKPPSVIALGQMVPESIPTIQWTASHRATGLTIGSDPLIRGQLLGVPPKGV